MLTPLCCVLLSLATIDAWAQPGVSGAASQTACSGTTATFTVTATGTPTLQYQWQVSPDGATWTAVTNGTSYSGATTAALAILNVPTSLNGSSYRCVVTNSQGSTNSSAGTLTVKASPIPQQVNQVYAICSSDVTGSLQAETDPSSNYQWQLSTDNGSTWNSISDGAVYTGTNAIDLDFNLDLSMNGNLYRFIMTDPVTGCSATSTGVDSLYVIGSPSVLNPTPSSANICPGAATGFTIADSAGVSYQWQVSTNNGASWSNVSDGSNYTGSATNSMAITGINTAARFHVIRSVEQHGTTCSTYSGFAPLSIKTIASIATQPANDTVCSGLSASFKVVAAGTGAFSYQWQTDNRTSPIVWSNTGSGTTSATLNVGIVDTTKNGYHYQVLVQGACGGQLTSGTVTLFVNSSGTWLGKADTAWGNGANWCGGVPVQATDVLIPAAAPRMPTISTATGTAYSTALNIQNGAILTINGGATSMYGPFRILGTVAYTATGDQQILPADHGSLTIGGSGNKFLQSNTAISNTLTLGGTAMLVTGNNILTMNTGSNPISGASFGAAATSWIVTGNGGSGAANTGLGGLRINQVSSSGGSVLYPVGATPAYYTPALFTNGGAANDFTIAVNDQNIPGGPLGAVVDRTWLISAANPGSSNISLGLQWNLADEPNTFDRTNAAIIRSNGTNIVEKSGAGAASGSNPYSLSKGGFSTLTQFSVGTNSMIVLPLQLLSFSAQWLGNSSASLSWQTDPQFMARSFIVQHSDDGIRFSNIGLVNAGKGMTSYSFVDAHPVVNNSYRLQLVADDGSIAYSRVIQLSSGAMTDQAALAPSVIEGTSSTLLLNLAHGSDVDYLVSDISGRIVSRNSISLSGGPHALTLDLSHLPGGIYFVRVTCKDGFNKVLSLVKK